MICPGKEHLTRIYPNWQFIKYYLHNTHQAYLQNYSQGCWVGIYDYVSWWRHQMETFSALLAICAGNSPVPGDFPTQRPVTRSFDVYFDLRPNKRLSKQSWGCWFETLSPPLWRHRHVLAFFCFVYIKRSWWIDSDLFTHILQRYFIGTRLIACLSQRIQSYLEFWVDMTSQRTHGKITSLLRQNDVACDVVLTW